MKKALILAWTSWILCIFLNWYLEGGLRPAFQSNSFHIFTMLTLMTSVAAFARIQQEKQQARASTV
ncbi:hypothetical protein [Corynebacterium uterequi]|uniref:Uncharacterized protein n=1 Tax=Corynebacterium uterequi TaxID=1072256 RepID=A0A0G3HAA9_9CORY|nr:hypothetical protein [Corynebacterium uterequi]AKK10296.1 hypothetical protein CUTER_01380 [Corynebacterium uterequi]